MSKRKTRSKVFLVGFDSSDQIVERIELSYDKYYSGGVPIVDSDAYRAKMRIRRLKGEIYDSTGEIQQRFDNRYTDDGSYQGGRTVHADGTTIED
jgi:hypothetical protein